MQVLKKVAKYMSCVLVFLVIFLAVLEPVSRIFTPKTEVDRDKNYRKICFSYRSEERNTLDCFVVGNSDAYRCFIPNELWRDYGITSSVSGMGRQNAKRIYSILKEVLDKQNPQVVLLETDFMFNTKNTDVINRLSKGGKKESKFKLVFTKGVANFDDIALASMAYIFPVFKYHARWKNLTKNDFNFKEVYNSEFKGYVMSKKVDGYPYGFDYMTDDNTAKPTENKKEISTINKIFELLRKKNCKVILFTAPSAQSWSKFKHDYVTALAKNNNCEYIDFNVPNILPSFDWTKDTIDAGDHMNIDGAKKITSYLGKYLSDNFDFVDKRKDKAYSSWNDDLVVYDREAAKKE